MIAGLADALFTRPRVWPWEFRHPKTATFLSLRCAILTAFLHRRDKTKAQRVQSRNMKSNEPDARRSCLIHDQTFIQRGDHWIHPAVEQMASAPRFRVRFDSREYFELISRHPKALPYLQGARNVQLPLDDAVYEIYE